MNIEEKKRDKPRNRLTVVENKPLVLAGEVGGGWV